MEEKKETSTGEKEVKNFVNLAQVPTEVQEVFEVDGEYLNLHQYLAWIGNLLIKLDKRV